MKKSVLNKIKPPKKVAVKKKLLAVNIDLDTYKAFTRSARRYKVTQTKLLSVILNEAL